MNLKLYVPDLVIGSNQYNIKLIMCKTTIILEYTHENKVIESVSIQLPHCYMNLLSLAPLKLFIKGLHMLILWNNDRQMMMEETMAY